MWVVKCGGSLAGDARLGRCLEMLAAHTAGLLVIPGGGVFADCVREQQPRLRYDDQTAHRMALLAMDQFACYLRALEPRLIPFSSIDDAAAAARRGEAALLQASAELAAAPLPASWATTADSLAVHVAGRVKAGDLLLLKARAIQRDEISAHELARDAYVDALFADAIETAAFGIWCLEPDPERLAETLNAPGPPATRIK